LNIHNDFQDALHKTLRNKFQGFPDATPKIRQWDSHVSNTLQDYRVFSEVVRSNSTQNGFVYKMLHPLAGIQISFGGAPKLQDVLLPTQPPVTANPFTYGKKFATTAKLVGVESCKTMTTSPAAHASECKVLEEINSAVGTPLRHFIPVYVARLLPSSPKTA
jgi:hypothetical protein